MALIRLVHLDVDVRSEELLRQLSYAISFMYKGAYNRTFPCLEATYPLLIP